MTFESQYETGKKLLLADSAICSANRKLFAKFFEYQEEKLKRMNRLRTLDDGCYKTLYGYVLKFRNVNAWFGNKPWSKLTREDIRDVYHRLEEGIILNDKGKPFGDTASYYNKVIKSKPFRMAGKAELAKEVIEYHANRVDSEVRFITEETFRKMISTLSNPRHLLLFWLAWDIGENINSLLRLTKREFRLQRNSDSGEPEYLVTLPRDILKRSRTVRSEPTLYPETVRYADIVLRDLSDDDPIFTFEYRQALKILHGVVAKTGATCLPHNDRVKWKDLRSGMACHLLHGGWTREEVNARLGHKPSSRVLDAYINHLAIDRRRPQQKLRQTNIEELKVELEESRRQAKLLGSRVHRLTEENEDLRQGLSRTEESLTEMRRDIERFMGAKSRSAVGRQAG